MTELLSGPRARLYVTIEYVATSRWLHDKDGKPERTHREFRVPFEGDDLTRYLLDFIRIDRRTRSGRRLKAVRPIDWYVEEDAIPVAIYFVDGRGRRLEDRTPRQLQVDQATKDMRRELDARVRRILAEAHR